MSASESDDAAKRGDSRAAALQQDVLNRIAAVTAALREPRAGGSLGRRRA